MIMLDMGREQALFSEALVALFANVFIMVAGRVDGKSAARLGSLWWYRFAAIVRGQWLQNVDGQLGANAIVEDDVTKTAHQLHHASRVHLMDKMQNTN